MHLLVKYLIKSNEYDRFPRKFEFYNDLIGNHNIRLLFL